VEQVLQALQSADGFVKGCRLLGEAEPDDVLLS
jgi:hypothetical protein